MFSIVSFQISRAIKIGYFYLLILTYFDASTNLSITLSVLSNCELRNAIYKCLSINRCLALSFPQGLERTETIRDNFVTLCIIVYVYVKYVIVDLYFV